MLRYPDSSWEKADLSSALDRLLTPKLYKKSTGVTGGSGKVEFMTSRQLTLGKSGEVDKNDLLITGNPTLTVFLCRLKTAVSIRHVDGPSPTYLNDTEYNAALARYKKLKNQWEKDGHSMMPDQFVDILSKAWSYSDKACLQPLQLSISEGHAYQSGSKRSRSVCDAVTHTSSSKGLHT